MNDSPRFVTYKNILRGMILVLLVISLLGPWMFDLIFVPAEYTCSAPNVRLYGDFCGMPLSGVQYFGLFVGGFFYMLLEVIKGTFQSRSGELVIGLLVLPFIPFFTTLLSIWKKETPRLRTVNLVAWTMALIPTLLMFNLSIIQLKGHALGLWGLWLYIITAICAIILEIALLKRKTNETQTFASPV